MVKSVAAAVVALAALAAAPSPDSGFDSARERMVRDVVRTAASAGVKDPERLSPAVLDAMRRVPRHQFVPASLRARAYENRPLPIGQGQTISQPYIVALMTDAVKPAKTDVVLEVGTGSGYQAAVLATLVDRVYSIEIVAPLAAQAAARLQELGYRNVTVRHGDGYAGWPRHAPFNAIVVTAGAPHVPQPLVQQLKPGGRMIIPVDRRDGGQELMLITKDIEGKSRTRSLGPVMFVPLTGPGARRSN